MAGADKRSYVEQAAAGVPGLLIALPAALAESEFLSLGDRSHAGDDVLPLAAAGILSSTVHVSQNRC